MSFYCSKSEEVMAWYQSTIPVPMVGRSLEVKKWLDIIGAERGITY
jgi:hypothetical protein